MTEKEVFKVILVCPFCGNDTWSWQVEDKVNPLYKCTSCGNLHRVCMSKTKTEPINKKEGKK